MIYLMNSPVLTRYGVWRFAPLPVEAVREQLQQNPYTSAIGHESTAHFLSRLLDINIESNRIQVEMGNQDKAIIFRIKSRLTEGRVLTVDEMAKIPYELGQLEWLGN